MSLASLPPQTQSLVNRKQQSVEAAPRGADSVRGVRGYDAQRKLLAPKPAASAQQAPAALSARRLAACQAGHQTTGRADWAMEASPMMALGLRPAAAGAAKVRDAVCNPAVPMSDVDAERLTAAVAAPIRSAELGHDTAAAAERKGVDPYIIGAKAVGGLANVAGGVCEAGLGPLGKGLGILRQMAGDASEEYFLGDGEYSIADAMYSAGTFALNEAMGGQITDRVASSIAPGATGDVLAAAGVAAKLLDTPRDLAFGESAKTLKDQIVPKKGQRGGAR